MREEISLKENAVYIVQDGRKTKVSPKEYGEDRIIWKHGKVLDIDRSERIRLAEQKEI